MRKHLFRVFLTDSSESEDRTKFIRKRVEIVQKHVPGLSSAFADYANRHAGLTVSGDKIALTLDNYAKAESVTTGMKQRLGDLARILYEIGAKRNYQVRSMELSILEELSEYGRMCKNVQAEVKSAVAAAERERLRLRQLRRLQEDRDDPQQISIAESEYIKARTDASRSAKSLDEQIDIFERRRLGGLRDALASWIVAELRFHAKALELFTDAYNVVAKIDVDADVEEFRNKLRAENTPRIDSSRDSSFQRSSSLVQLLAMPFHSSRERLTGIGIPHPSPSSGVPSLGHVNQSCLF